MKTKILTGLLLILILDGDILGQSDTYSVTLAPFSSKKNDEFSPVYYKQGIVFCTNRSKNLFLNYTSSQNKRLFKIYYAKTTGSLKSGRSKLFSNNLKTVVNDGPSTFNNWGDTIYYSRNLESVNDVSKLAGSRNKLGIFNAVLVNGQWTKIREFRFNNEKYNVSSPCLSPDGKRLFFASDRPGGFGGTDLYYCKWNGDYWNEPVNLGALINTQGDESFPFINPAGDLFFSSDGLPGLGGKDIFFSEFSGTAWLAPSHIDPPINSKYDDFGILTDTLMNEGYFSSARNKSIDIYHFKTNSPQILYSTIQKLNPYSFVFRDSGSFVIDTANLSYRWDFGDGKTSAGKVAYHCFEGPGDFKVKLDIIEKGSAKLFFSKLSYTLEIRNFKQPFINSADISVKGDIIEFDGFKSYLPGFKILNYSWDFGDGNRSSGESVKHSYQKKGEYLVNLCLTLKSQSTGNVNRTGISKKILVFNEQQDKNSYLIKETAEKTKFIDIKDVENVKIKIQHYAEMEFQNNAVFVVELVTSKKPIALNSSIFRNVPKKYRITEKFIPDDAIYSYTVDQQMSLMATYPAFRQMLALGFNETRTKMSSLKNQSEKELQNLIRINGAFADSYFDSSENLTSDAYIMLDQIVKLMKKHNSMKLELNVHTDNIGPAERNLALSQRHSQSMVNYIIKRGINTKRLVPTGFGGSKPIAPNYLEKDRKMNRRIDFTILD